jgi:hypothetical protein
MDRNDYLRHVSDLDPEEIVNGIRAGMVTFKELQETDDFSASRQRQVKEILTKYEEEDKAYKEATTLPKLRAFLEKYPISKYREDIEKKITLLEIEEKAEQRKKYDDIKRNINNYTPDEILKKLNENGLYDLCTDIGIDHKIVCDFIEPHLSYNDIIPVNEDDIPSGYTDVFFWGIPSSGKTCALSAIFSTINADYTIAEPETKTKFGATYRDSLANIFQNGIGYLPDSTAKDRTQYMPFLLKKRKENKYRKISFFELSGEVFKYFYEITNNAKILKDEDRPDVEKSYHSLNLLLNSKNQKIHFFFIDYNHETRGTRDKYNLTQSNYLKSAATYFRDNDDIFKKKTDAVYVVVTKADEISGDKFSSAKRFLSENFGGFMDMLKHRCERDSINFDVKLFSIGGVYFKRICKINRDFAKDIIEDLLIKVKPVSDNKISKFFNS